VRRTLPLGLLVALVLPGVAQARTALVSVSVATLWKAPGIARPMDAPALAAPADPRAWDRNLVTTADRLWLDSHVQTQALYGQQVTILARRGDWFKVAVTDEPDPQDPHGYPGWVPARQLALDEWALPGPDAIVTASSARLTVGGRTTELSFATELPLVKAAPATVTVRVPGGGTGTLPRRAVTIVRAPGHPTGAQIVATAERFLGIRYLWGGLSVFGFDCSGLVWAAYRSFGMTIPRDADPQFRHGTPVARADLRPGDLLFYGTQSYVHHVSIYAGHGQMVEAPDSAHRVRLVPVRWGEFAGARRY
jgi:cell wall-associated NlpC family hydrolase